MYKPLRHVLSGGIGFGVGHVMHKYENTVLERYLAMVDEEDNEDLFR